MANIEILFLFLFELFLHENYLFMTFITLDFSFQRTFKRREGGDGWREDEGRERGGWKEDEGRERGDFEKMRGRKGGWREDEGRERGYFEKIRGGKGGMLRIALFKGISAIFYTK